MNRLFRRYGLFYVRYMDDFVIMAQKRHQLPRAIKCVHEVLGRLGLRLHGSKRLIGKLSKGFDFLGYRMVPGVGSGLLLKVSAALLRNSAGFTSRGQQHAAMAVCPAFAHVG